MPIYIQQSKEPFAAAPATRQVVLAESAAYSRLCTELYRYAAGEISGRSFLISGHRGSGKTTLVLKAIEDTTARASKDGLGIRPLLIPLHGPDLLSPRATPASATPETQGSNQGGNKSQESSAETPAANDTQEFLRQVTIGFYRALADMFHQAYWRVAHRKAEGNQPRWRDLPEMAAQLRVELDGAPDLGLLREYWKKADALQVGILPMSETPPQPPNPAITPETWLNPPALDQGMLELLALSSAAQAYQLVRGKLQTKEGTKQDDTSKSSLTFQTVGEVKNLLNPLLGLLAGGAVGWGLKSAELPTLVAALAGTATGLGTAVTLNFTSSRSHENSRSREVTFLPDTTIASLDRMVPLLVERCRQAGVAPVFVVDELDKVSALEKRMGPLVRHLKSLVTEKTFFCFLADRSYLEGLRRELLATPYRTEYTYFSDRVFVVYRPGDLHKYLGNVLRATEPTNSNDTIDLEVLPYVLLHRSRLHPFDLRRQLARMRGSDGAISLPPGVVRTELAYRFDVLIQVAMEWLLEQPELRERLSQDEDFTQLIYDTLYYPSRMWERGSTDLDVSRDTFFKYLEERMSPTLGADPSNDGIPAAEAGARPAGNDCALSDLDKNFLFSRLRELVGFLAEPERLRKTVTSESPKLFPTNVLDAIPADPKFKLLDFKSVDGRAMRDVYVWRRDVFGRSVGPSGVDFAGDVEPNEKFIQELQAKLNEIAPSVNLDRLAAEYNVLSATPAWNSVLQALRRLNRLRGEGRVESYSEMEADANAVWEYSQMLQASGTALAEALVAARVLGRLAQFGPSPPEMLEQTMVQGLTMLRGFLGLRSLSIAETRQKLGRTMAELQAHFPWLAFGGGQFDLKSVPVEDWAARLRAALRNPTLSTIDRTTANQFTEEAERTWLERFTQFFRSGTTQFEPTAADLICGAAWVGISGLLSLDLSEVGIVNWTNLLCWSFVDMNDASRAASPILGVPALFQLGFGKQVTDCVTSGQFFMAPLPKFAKLQENRSTVQDWIAAFWTRRQAAAVKPGVVVVLDSSSPLVVNWKPSAKYAAVAVDKGTLWVLRQALQGIWNPALISRVIVELRPDYPLNPQVSPAADLSAFSELMSLPYSYVSRSAPQGPVPDGYPLVISPKTLDEAVDLAAPISLQTTNAPAA